MSEAVVEKTDEVARRTKLVRDWPASLLGGIVFIVGIALLALVFSMAYSLYFKPASELVEVGEKTLDLQGLIRSSAATLIRIILLFVMSVAGSLLAGRGAQMYLASRSRADQ